MPVKAGLPPAEVLRIATIGAARVMKRDQELGSLEPGKLADVILVAGNPSVRVSDIRRVKTVLKDGVVYDADAVYRAFGVGPN